LRYLKQGQADLQQEPVRVSELLTELQNDMLTLSEAKGHHLELALPDEDATVLIDPIRIGMALTNLLNNAIRFTPPGGRICIEAEVRHGEEVWITITDDGIGLTEQQVQRVFEEFYQVEDHMTRRNG